MLRVTVLGAGFAGLELATTLSEEIGDELDLTLIDQNDAFVFGFSKLDMMFGRETPDAIRLPYAKIRKSGVHFRQETVRAIDPSRRLVRTNRGAYESDVLVVALGADYDVGATPGLAEAGHEFYSVPGARALRDRIPKIESGRWVIGVAGAPYKCPPAPAEAALLLADHLTERGVRSASTIELVIPANAPPPGPASGTFLEAFRERNIALIPGRSVRALEPSRKVAILDDGRELPFDTFLGVPRHRVPDVVVQGGLAEVGGWVHVDPGTLTTRFPGVYAVGDVTDIEAPMVGVFAEQAARVVAKSLIAQGRGGPPPAPFTGTGSCYIEFGQGRVGRADMDFLSGPHPKGSFAPPSLELAAEKQRFGTTRRARWFGC